MDQPSDGVDEPSDAVDQPSDGSEPPAEGANDGSGQSAQPTGAVEGVVGTPGITPPPTDTLVAATAPTAGSDGWRVALALIAFALVGTLLFTTPQPARRRA